MSNTFSRQKILIVDDAPANLEILNETLMSDYDVSVCKSGPEALELLAENTFDLVLLDVMIDAMDGYEVCRQMKKDEKTATIPVIFISARAEVHDEVKGFELGAVDYITKPFRPVLVLSRVRTQLELKRYRDELSEIVLERTDELNTANQKLEKEIEIRKKAERDLEKLVREKTEALSKTDELLKKEIADRKQAEKLIGQLSKIPWFQ